jgi:hypothetical protein
VSTPFFVVQLFIGDFCIASFDPMHATVFRRNTAHTKKPFYDAGSVGDNQRTMRAWYQFTAAVYRHYKVSPENLEWHRPVGLFPISIPRELKMSRVVEYDSLTATVPGHIVKLRDAQRTPIGQIYRNKGCSMECHEQSIQASLAMRYTPDMLCLLRDIVCNDLAPVFENAVAAAQRAEAGRILFTIIDTTLTPHV